MGNWLHFKVILPISGSRVDHPTIASRTSGWHLQLSGSPDYCKQNQWVAFAVEWITRLLQTEPVGGICSGVDHPTIASRKMAKNFTLGHNRNVTSVVLGCDNCLRLDQSKVFLLYTK